MKTLMKWIAIGGCLLLAACANLMPAQGPLLRLDHVHPFGATRLAFSPDSRRVASGGYQGEVMIWQVPGGKRLRRLKGHTAPVRGLVWVNAAHLISAAEDGRIVLWDTRTGKRLRSVKTTPVTATARNAKAGVFVTGHANGEVQVRSARDLSVRYRVVMSSRVLSVAVRPGSGEIAVSLDNGSVSLFSPRLTRARSLRKPPRNALELRFSPDGRQLAAGAWFKLLLWDMKTGKLSVRDTEHTGAIISIDYSPDGKRIVSLGRHTDANIRLRNLKSRKLERRLAPHEYCGWQIRFSPNGRYVGSVSEDESLRLYDLSKPYKPRWNWSNQRAEYE